jgi:hypothetical protein
LVSIKEALKLFMELEGKFGSLKRVQLQYSKVCGRMVNTLALQGTYESKLMALTIMRLATGETISTSRVYGSKKSFGAKNMKNKNYNHTIHLWMPTIS